MSIDFNYSAIVFIFDDDTPDVVHYQEMVDHISLSLSEIDALGEVEDQFKTEGLVEGVYRVWLKGDITFSTYNGHEGVEDDQDVVVNEQRWDKLSEGELEHLKFMLLDVEPVMLFYSASPVPEPNWEMFATGRPVSGPEDAPATHHFWRRVDDDGRTLYQCSGVAEKMPTLMDGAYFDYATIATVKGLAVKLMVP